MNARQGANATAGREPGEAVTVAATVMLTQGGSEEDIAPVALAIVTLRTEDLGNGKDQLKIIENLIVREKIEIVQAALENLEAHEDLVAHFHRAADLNQEDEVINFQENQEQVLRRKILNLKIVSQEISHRALQ